MQLSNTHTNNMAQPIVRVMRSRGSRVMQHERPVAGPLRLEGLTDEHVAAMCWKNCVPGSKDERAGGSASPCTSSR